MPVHEDSQEVAQLRENMRQLTDQVLRLEHKLAEMHATPAAAYKRAYKSLAQHVEALNLEAETVQHEVEQLRFLDVEDDIAEAMATAGVVGVAALLITQILPSTPLQNLKRSGDLKKGVWILAAGVLTMKCLMAGFRSLKHGLFDIPRQNRRLVGEWEVLKSRIAIMHELLHWAAAEDPALACGNGSSSQTAAAAVSIAVCSMPETRSQRKKRGLELELPAAPTNSSKRARTQEDTRGKRKGNQRASAAEQEAAGVRSDVAGAAQTDQAGPGTRSQTPAPSAAPPEPQVTDMDRSGEEDKGLAGDAGQAKDGADAFGRDLNRANTALQGLLRKLGAGFDDMVSPSGLSSSKLKNIMATLKAPEDDMAQLETLGRLCEMLSISSEEQLSVLPVDQLVPVLVSLLNAEHSPDLMLLAARAITFLADVMPSACSAIVRHGAVPAFCARLMTIEYIDLAEQSLQALEKLSHEHPAACLRHGGLLATLSYLDFFQTGVQRVAVATAANMCRCLTSENTEAVSSAVPMLTSLLQYSDAKVVDNACLALSRIAQAFSSSPKSLEMLCEYGLITNAVQLISVSETGSMTSQLSVSTYYGLIKLLSTCVKGSHTVAENLLQAGMSGTLRNLLQSSTLFSTSRTSPASVLRSSDQLLEVMSLAHELLPSVPDAAQLLFADANPATEAEGRNGAGHQKPAAPSSRELFLQQNPELLQKFGSDLLPLLLQVYNNTALPQVRKQCLAAIAKILHYTPAGVLDDLLKDIAISSCIAGLLASKDAQVAARALQLAEVLMQKLPDVFLRYFTKEGVVHAIDQLAAAAPPSLPVPKEPKRKGRRQSPRAKKQKGKDKEREGAKEGEDRTLAEQAAAAASAAGRSPPHAGCAAAAVAAGAPISGGPAGPNLRTAVAIRAQKFRACYLPSQGSGAQLETEGVQKLREVCRDLGGEGKVQELLALIQDKGASNISTFELLSSGAVRQLRAHLLGADLHSGHAAVRGKGKRSAQPSSAASMSRHQVALLERLRSFAQAGLTPGVGGSAPMQPLVRKLQQALAATEAFPVADSHEVPVGRTGSLRYGGSPFFGHSRSTGDGSSLGNGLAALSQPFKLRLAAASHEKQLVDYSVNVVLIDTMASLSAVEDFLYGKVYRSAAAAEQARAAAEAAAAAARQKAANKSSPGPAATPSRVAVVADRSPQAAASDAHIGAGLAREAEPSGRSSGEEAQQSAAAPGAGPAGAGARRPRSAKQDIPHGKTTASQRMTRASARRAAAELDHHPAPAEEEAVQAPPSEAVPAEGPSGTSEEDEGMMMMEEDEELGELTAEERAAIDAAHASAVAAGVAPMDEEDDHYDDDELDDEIGHDEDEPPTFGSAPVHDVHVGPSDGSAAAAATAAHAEQVIAAASAAAASAAAAAQDARANSDQAAAGGSGSLPQEGRSAGQAAPSRPAAAQATRGRQVSYAEATGSRSEGPRLQFYVAGKTVPLTTTIFKAVQMAHAARYAGDKVDEAGGGASQAEGSAAQRPKRLWDDIWTLQYSRVENQAPETGPAASTAVPAAQQDGSCQATASSSRQEEQQQQASTSTLEELLQPRLPEGLGADEGVRDTLLVLKVLEAINRNSGQLIAIHDGLQGHADRKAVKHGQAAREEFISSKLAPKLAQQLKDVLAICGDSLPPWCQQLVFSCKFLFPFDMRRRFFYCTAFGPDRALQHLRQLQIAEGGSATHTDREIRDSRSTRISRQKVRVSRMRILESAEKVMSLYASSKAILELEYFNEVGTGLGPTLEFYTLLSHELQRKGLGMWHSDDGVSTPVAAAVPTRAADKPQAQVAVKGRGHDLPLVAPVQDDMAGQGQQQQFVMAPQQATLDDLASRMVQGLFAAPQPPAKRKANSRVLELFKLLGRAMAKALQDGRLLDLPLSYVFYRATLGQPLDLYDIRRFDAGIGATLEKLHAAHQAHLQAGRQGPLMVDGVPIEELCLTFVLPGYPEYPLRPDGADVMVDASNVSSYIKAVVDALLETGIKAQMEAFRDGFNEVFPLSVLACFFEDEIEAMLCGAGESWTVEALAETIKFDHGYTAQSTAISYFLQILTEFDAADQRRFLRFVTGTPRLPPGGIAALHPRLTVVRKHTSQPSDPALGASASPAGSSLGHQGSGSLADGDLPSVMTCANYIKLPPYSSKAVMKERVLYAIREGQGSFDLS